MSKKLHVFQDLEITGDDDTFGEFLSILNQNLKDKGWNRNFKTEEKFESQYYAINTKMENEDLNSTLFLEIDTEKYVSNIVPQKKSSLTIEEYNEILNTFYSEFIAPIESKYANLTFKLTNDKVELSDFMSEESVELLQSFSSAANKSTGSSHPLDKNRWYNFIINVVNKNEEFNVDILNRWLVEIEGWSEDIAIGLIGEFEFGTRLLKKFIEINLPEGLK